ncbi:MAG: RNA polymerase sigma factor [Chloroflexota bacterium]
MQTESDEQLMGRVKLGGGEALSLLVERHHSPLIGYLYRMVGGDRALAEDLVQETFVRVITSRSYRPTQPFKPWLYAIATNLARDHFKAADTRYLAGDPDIVGSGERAADQGVAPGPEDAVLRAERGQEVAAAMARLSPEYRSALLLRFYGELSLQEIAAALGIPVGTVKSRLSVGCRRLRDLLAGESVANAPVASTSDQQSEVGIDKAQRSQRGHGYER